MKYKIPAAVAAGALLALGTTPTAHAAGTGNAHPTHDTDAPTHTIAEPTPADHLSTHEVGRLLHTTDDITDVLHHPQLSRDKGSLIDNGPRSTGMTLANVPLRVSTPD